MIRRTREILLIVYCSIVFAGRSLQSNAYKGASCEMNGTYEEHRSSTGIIQQHFVSDCVRAHREFWVKMY